MGLENKIVAGFVQPVLAEKLEENQKNDKGSIGNKIEYGVKQGFHLRNTMLKDQLVTAAGTAASVGTAVAVAKSEKAQNIISKGLKNLGEKITNSKTLKDIAESIEPYAQKAANFIGKLPGPAKAVLVAGLALTGIASQTVRSKGIYEAGKIDQEYTDKAKLQKQLD